MENKCLHETVLLPVQGKWKAELVYLLSAGPMRLGALEQRLPEAIPRVLKRQLRGLEKDDIVRRISHAGVSPIVEYSLTEEGQSLHSLLIAINEAAEEHMKKFRKSP